MKRSINKKRFRLYLWLAAAYFFIWLLHDIDKNPDNVLKKCWNQVWLLSYLVVLNFILFEYTLPFIRLTLKRILLWPVLLFAHLMLYSFGFYGWRQFGIALHL